MTRRRPVEVRLLERVSIDSQTGCWVWTGGVSPDGYAQLMVRIGGKGKVTAHRISYELFSGPIPRGMELDHLCHTNSDCLGGKECLHRRCVNPDHLEPVTRGENILRSMKDRCKHGHLLDDGNTYMNAGHRHCKTCRRSAERRYQDKKKAEADR